VTPKHVTLNDLEWPCCVKFCFDRYRLCLELWSMAFEAWLYTLKLMLYRRTLNRKEQLRHPGAVLAQKFCGGGALPPSAPTSPRSIFSVLRNRKKYELHMQCVPKKVTPFWYLSFLPLLCIIFAIFVYLHTIYIKCLISEPVQVYCRQYKWTLQQDGAPSHKTR